MRRTEVVSGVGHVAVEERLRALDVTRLVGLTIVVAAGLVGVAPLKPLVALSAGHAAVALLGWMTRRRLARRAAIAAGALLILDACYLAAAMALSGGTASPLRYLVMAHVVAAALLASARTGAKLLVWHTLLVAIAAAAQRSGLPALQEAAYPAQEAVTLVAGSWIVGATTSAAAALNERVLRRARSDIEGLAQAMTALEGRQDPGAVAQALVDATAATYGFRRALLVDAGGSKVLASTLGTSRAATAATMGARVGPTRTLGAARAAHGLLLVDRLDPVDDALLAAALPDARNLVIVPLLDDDRRIATLVLEHAGERIDARTVELVRRVAAHGALALGNAHLVELLRARADRDGLTQVANRGALDRELKRVVARAGEAGTAVAVLLIDIDHFKQLNDTHGHQAGDTVLKAVARSLASGCRPGDFVGRYGGEEFAVILPGAGAHDAEEVAERLREGIASLPAEVAAVTVSVGYACIPDHATDAVEVLAVADAALYAAKDGGRDRVGRPQDAPTDVLTNVPPNVPTNVPRTESQAAAV